MNKSIQGCVMKNVKIEVKGVLYYMPGMKSLVLSALFLCLTYM